MHSFKFLAVLGLIATSACSDDHTPLTFNVAGTEITATGEIDADALDAFEDILDDYPDATTLVLNYIGGSVDDEANVALARMVRDAGLSTRVPSNGLVASGGTDLFLAGVERVLDAGACVGVHSWAAEDFTATDLPRDDAEHDRYLNYYEDMGIAPSFYWFTLEAAPADGMYWMTSQDAGRFGISTNEASNLGSNATCDGR